MAAQTVPPKRATSSTTAATTGSSSTSYSPSSSSTNRTEAIRWLRGVYVRFLFSSLSGMAYWFVDFLPTHCHIGFNHAILFPPFLFSFPFSMPASVGVVPMLCWYINFTFIPPWASFPRDKIEFFFFPFLCNLQWQNENFVCFSSKRFLNSLPFACSFICVLFSFLAFLSPLYCCFVRLT